MSALFGPSVRNAISIDCNNWNSTSWCMAFMRVFRQQRKRKGEEVLDPNRSIKVCEYDHKQLICEGVMPT